MKKFLLGALVATPILVTSAVASAGYYVATCGWVTYFGPYGPYSVWVCG